MEETQEGGTEDVVMLDTQPMLRSEDLKNLVLEKRQALAESAMLQAQTRRLSMEKETLKKQLEEKQIEISKLQAKHQRTLREKKEQIKRLEEKMGEDKEERKRLLLKTAELERQLEQKNKDNEKLRRDFSEKEREIRNQHERDIESLKMQLLEEKTKAEIEIKELNNQILSKEVEKLTILETYRDQERALERERDNLKVELAKLHQSITEEKCKTLQQEKEAAERGYHESLALIEELQEKLGSI